MKIGYVKASIIEEESKFIQMEKMKKIKVNKIFIETDSLNERKELENLMNFIQEKDIVYIYDLSKLANSTKSLLEIIKIFRRKKITLVTFKEKINSSTIMGKLMLDMIQIINDLEKKNLLEKQKKGIYNAKKLNKYKGRKPIKYPENWEKIYIEWKLKKIQSKNAREILNLKKTTFYNLIKKWEK